MMNQVVLISLLASFIQNVNTLTLHDRKYAQSIRSVINGYDAPSRLFYVQLLLTQLVNNTLITRSCGATIIEPRWVLTAAHCVMGPLKSIHAEVGDFSVFNSKKTSIPGDAFVHEGYENPEYDENYAPLGKPLVDDIALVKLQSKVPKSAQILPLCRKSYGNSSFAIKLAGMGLIYQGNIVTGEFNPPNPEDLVLQEVELNETSQCPRLWNGYTPDMFQMEREICMVGQNKSACYGDSGGPLFPVDNQDKAICIYGTVSHGTLACLGGATVFERVSFYEDWIESTIRENSIF